MGAPKVIPREIDLSTRVPSFPGVYGGIVIAAKKGPIDEPQLVTSESQLLSVFTPDERVEVGYDLAYFSALAFLQRSDKLWISRAVNNALHGGVVLRSSTSGFNNFALSAGIADPDAYVFDSGIDSPAVAEVRTVLFSQLASYYDISGPARALRIPDQAGVIHYFYFVVTGGSNVQTDPAFAGQTGHIVDINIADSAAQIAGKFQAVVDGLASFTAAVSSATVTVTNAVGGACADASDVDASVAIVTTIQGVDAINNVDECILIHGANPGVWNNNILVKSTRYVTDPDLVKEPNSFLIQVFKSSNLSNPVESFICSRVQGARDGFGRNIYVEDVLKSSNYIRAIDNLSIPETVQPKDQSTALSLGGGTDGSAVTDSQRIAAAAKLANKDTTLLTVIMDGGNATPAYQQYLYFDIAETRRDCVAVLSVPFASEASATYLNDIVEYRKVTLNANTSWAALYTPHVLVYDKYNDRRIYVSPDGYAAAAISFSASNFEIWYPPAGFRRGIINVLDLRRRFTSGELDALYDAGINPLRFAPGKGIAIWGQKTLLSRPSALDRLNVRLLLIVVVPATAAALEDFLFEFNDAATRALVTSKLETYFDGIQSRRGLERYQVVCNDTNNTPADIDANRLNVDIFVVPLKSAEEIPLRVIITPSSLSFEAAGDLV